MTHILAENEEVSFQNIFIDGTKLEAVANKYTFVWKKAVTKNQQKLTDKIPSLFQETEKLFGIKIVYGNLIKQHHLKRFWKKLKKLQAEKGIPFVRGIGKRNSSLQKALEQLTECMDLLKRYNKYLHIAGDRNSFSKIDHLCA
jgi:hypothetical protein